MVELKSAYKNTISLILYNSKYSMQKFCSKIKYLVLFSRSMYYLIWLEYLSKLTNCTRPLSTTPTFIKFQNSNNYARKHRCMHALTRNHYS